MWGYDGDSRSNGSSNADSANDNSRSYSGAIMNDDLSAKSSIRSFDIPASPNGLPTAESAANPSPTWSSPARVGFPPSVDLPPPFTFALSRGLQNEQELVKPPLAHHGQSPWNEPPTSSGAWALPFAETQRLVVGPNFAHPHSNYITQNLNERTPQLFCIKGYDEIVVNHAGLNDHATSHPFDNPCAWGWPLYSQNLVHFENNAPSDIGVKEFVYPYIHNVALSKQRWQYTDESYTDEGRLTCDDCGRKCLSSAGLTKHKAIHIDEYRFACDVCGKKFATEGYLIAHERLAHSEKKYACELCSERFAHHVYLVNHMGAYAKGKKFQCDICRRKIWSRRCLKKHMKIHTREQGTQL